MKYKKINNIIIKLFKKELLLSDNSFIIDRISKINNFDFQKYESLVRTNILESENNFIYIQLFQKRVKPYFHKDKMIQLAEALDYFLSQDFVHGDINRRNVLCTSSGYKIVDYEPDIFQKRNCYNTFVFTQPYISQRDIVNFTLTSLTDKIGFCYFILRMCNMISSREIFQLNESKVRNHELLIGLPESDINVMTNLEIVNFYINSLKLN